MLQSMGHKESDMTERLDHSSKDTQNINFTTVSFLQAYSPGALRTCTLLYDHHLRPSPELSISPNRRSVPRKH